MKPGGLLNVGEARTGPFDQGQRLLLLSRADSLLEHRANLGLLASETEHLGKADAHPRSHADDVSAVRDRDSLACPPGAIRRTLEAACGAGSLDDLKAVMRAALSVRASAMARVYDQRTSEPAGR